MLFDAIQKSYTKKSNLSTMNTMLTSLKAISTKITSYWNNDLKGEYTTVTKKVMIPQ